MFGPLFAGYAGSNDGLFLIGIPGLHADAWLAFASMVPAIAAAMSVQRIRG